MHNIIGIKNYIFLTILTINSAFRSIFSVAAAQQEPAWHQETHSRSHTPPDAFPAQGSRHTGTPGLSRLRCVVSGGGVALREQKSGGRGVGVIARPPSPVPQVKLRASGLSTTRQKHAGSENWPRASPLKGWPARCRNSPGWFPSLAAVGSVSSCPQSYSLKGERPFLCLSVFLGDLGPGEHL